MSKRILMTILLVAAGINISAWADSIAIWSSNTSPNALTGSITPGIAGNYAKAISFYDVSDVNNVSADVLIGSCNVRNTYNSSGRGFHTTSTCSVNWPNGSIGSHTVKATTLVYIGQGMGGKGTKVSTTTTIVVEPTITLTQATASSLTATSNVPSKLVNFYNNNDYLKSIASCTTSTIYPYTCNSTWNAPVGSSNVNAKSINDGVASNTVSNSLLVTVAP